MIRTLGVDLGTNSIGLTLREDDIFSWYGVYTFKKGVGEGKSGEFSLAAERTKHRSSRRLYNSRRYRKWETLKVLIENDFCPLDFESLNKWTKYKKGIGRTYPIFDEKFDQWIKLDFNGDGIQDFASPYELRCMLINSKLNLDNIEDRHKIGRALYHISQRRGFKSSRKNGDNEKTSVYKGSNETNTIGRDEYSELLEKHGSLGSALRYIEKNGLRVRNRYTLRSDYEKEVVKILDTQKIGNDFKDSIIKAIFFQRPLRSQKGLVGKCTLEKNKTRCPISHPKYEEYIAWSFINNIKYKSKDCETFVALPLTLKEKLYNEKFFLKSKKNFQFKEIRKFINLNGGKDWELNFSTKMDDKSVPSSYVSARLKSVFGEDWENYNKIVEREYKGLKKKINYSINDIWHILYSFEDEECLVEFLDRVLELDENQITELKYIFNSFPMGYSNLSLKAISNILRFLRQGYIYSEAVILAKIPEIIGNNIFEDNKKEITNAVTVEMNKVNVEKVIVNITNNLISKYYSQDYDERIGWRNTNYVIDESDIKDIELASIEYYGDKTWLSFDDDFKKYIISKISDLYQDFFSSEKKEYFKQPHLVNKVKQFLITEFALTDKQVEKLYHPSQIDIYPKKEDQIYLSSPKTSAFKNPMAYKTLNKLREVINYLIETNKIDKETRIVVEIARELNDKNRRSAIEKYQRDREAENIEFSKAISELLRDKDFKGNVDPNSDSDKDKLRLWLEQSNNSEELLKNIDAINRDKKMDSSHREIQKYRLWKEQNCICIYTGKIIRITDLFDINKIDFEHTIPRSKSFDNSLSNLTVCYADYNRNIKNNKLPVELPNYEVESNGYSAIKPRLEVWEKKVDDLYNQIDFWRFKSKTANDKETKDKAIRELHLRQMSYDYWSNKLDRFKRKEVTQGFINSQLVDTQIITKYAFHYLKTVFPKVDVVKGVTTSQFRKIFGFQSFEDLKDRGKHYHHAIDAAVLTLIPTPKKREEILRRAYEFEESNYKKQYHEKPFKGFNYYMIDEIKNNLLVYNLVDKDRTLTPVIKKVRKRGRIVWIDRENNIPKFAKGDAIRGELHQQTYYGKIKVAAKNEDGSLSRDEDGKIIYNQVNGKDEIWMVIRKPIEKINFMSDIIVDSHLSKHLLEQLNQGVKQNELKDFNGKVLRHIRCRVKAARGFMNPDNVTIVKEQVYKSKKDYKNYIYADSGDNYLFGLYKNDNGMVIVPLNLFEAAIVSKEIEKVNYADLFKTKEPIYIGKGKSRFEANLVHVFKLGQKVLFYDESKYDLKELNVNELSNRLYFVKNLADAKQGLIRFQHHLESRDDNQLSEDFPSDVFGMKGKNGFSKFTNDFIAPRLLLSTSNYNFIIEGKDFEMMLDGTIVFNY